MIPLKKFLVGFIFIASLSALAMTKEGATLPDHENVQNHLLVLNGIGFRKATFLKLKVYSAGLYLEKKSQNPDEIINSPGFKKVTLKFLRNVSADDVKGAWEKNFKNLCETSPCAPIQAEIQKLKESMVEMKEGDLMSYTFTPGNVDLEIQGEKKAQFSSPLLAQLILKAWMGPNPPNSELKEGLLGL